MIRRGGGLVDLDRTQRERRPFSGADLAHVLSSRKLWGVYLGQFALTSTLWFFLTWFPTYLVQARGMGFVKAGFLASLPFLAAFVGVLSSGLLSDCDGAARRLARHGAQGADRRGAPALDQHRRRELRGPSRRRSSPSSTLAFFGNGLASITWSLVSAIAPERLIGLTGGVFNFFGNLSGITVPIVIGYLARDYGFSAGTRVRRAARPPGSAVVRVHRRASGAAAGSRGRRRRTIDAPSQRNHRRECHVVSSRDPSGRGPWIATSRRTRQT